MFLPDRLALFDAVAGCHGVGQATRSQGAGVDLGYEVALFAEAGDRKDIHKLAVSLVRSNRPLTMELFATIASAEVDRQALR